MTAIALVVVCTLWTIAALFALSEARTPDQVARQVLALSHEQPLPLSV